MTGEALPRLWMVSWHLLLRGWRELFAIVCIKITLVTLLASPEGAYKFAKMPLGPLLARLFGVQTATSLGELPPMQEAQLLVSLLLVPFIAVWLGSFRPEPVLETLRMRPRRRGLLRHAAALAVALVAFQLIGDCAALFTAVIRGGVSPVELFGAYGSGILVALVISAPAVGLMALLSALLSNPVAIVLAGLTIVVLLRSFQHIVSTAISIPYMAPGSFELLLISGDMTRTALGALLAIAWTCIPIFTALGVVHLQGRKAPPTPNPAGKSAASFD